MKKPKTVKYLASADHAKILKCKAGAPVVMVSQADFNRMWELAKEAIHFNAATRTGE